MRPPLRASFALVLVMAACTGKEAPTTPVGQVGPAAPPASAAERAPGTTGFPGLDWGARADDVLALYPDARPGGAGLVWTGAVEGAPADVQFQLDGGGLHQLDILWTTTFASMMECGDALHQVRLPIDRRLGEGPEENLAVYWDTDTATVTLSCSPNEDDDRASLSQVYQRKVAE